MAVMQRVAGTVHARPLAIPHGEHPIDLALRVDARLLGTHHHGSSEVFINRRHEANVCRFQMAFSPPHSLVNPTKGRASIAADESCCAAAVRVVAATL